MKVKKIKLEVMSSYHGNSAQHGADSENGDLSSSVGLELPFMMMPHPLIPVSLPPASVTMAMSQMNHLSTIANMAAAAQGQSGPSRMVTSVIKERVPDSPSPAPSLEDGRRPGSRPSSQRSSSVSSSPAHTESSSDRIPVHQNGLSMNQALLGLSPSILPGPKEGDLATHDIGHEAKRMHSEKEEPSMCTPTARDSYERLSLAGQALPPGFPSPFLFPDGLSSIETLLTNIQGLLKVAIDNARAQEKQVQLEKTELKMELFRERELRETLEKQLAVEQKNRAIIQKRLKKEKKAKRKLQEALEYECKRREQAEQSLKQTSPTESLRSLNGEPRVTRACAGCPFSIAFPGRSRPQLMSSRFEPGRECAAGRLANENENPLTYMKALLRWMARTSTLLAARSRHAIALRCRAGEDLVSMRAASLAPALEAWQSSYMHRVSIISNAENFPIISNDTGA
ncbi:hypothetical protein P4O66_000853 [Electrophorus voltai]|uniref:Dachshund d n=1 Tax=Electrophorus voltai TaxID=2609070 RepID=A0AAD8ZEH3_9TELE|nr:hypothetical protein P4O66_000853 [Electrophorus voltai]